jgi:hypothetical protein
MRPTISILRLPRVIWRSRVSEVIRFEAATSVDYEVAEVVYHIAQGTNLRQRISVFLARIG